MPRLLPLLLLLAALVSAQAPQHPNVPAAAQATAHFDAKAATDAWLASLPPAFRTRSDAYFEGTYWLTLWDFLAGVAVCAILLPTRVSARMRDLAERATRSGFLQTLLYWAQFAVVTAVILFPLAVYEGFFREHRYGLSNQTFGAWLRDQAVGFAVSLVLAGLAVAALFAVVRRLPRTWHIWGTVVAIAFDAFTVAIAPVFIVPLFNTPKLLADSPIRSEILSLAHASGIPARDVLPDRRLPPEQPGERQCQRSRGHGAHHAERQPAAPLFAGRRPVGDGPRDGPLRDAPRGDGHPASSRWSSQCCLPCCDGRWRAR